MTAQLDGLSPVSPHSVELPPLPGHWLLRQNAHQAVEGFGRLHQVARRHLHSGKKYPKTEKENKVSFSGMTVQLLVVINNWECLFSANRLRQVTRQNEKEEFTSSKKTQKTFSLNF